MALTQVENFVKWNPHVFISMVRLINLDMPQTKPILGLASLLLCGMLTANSQSYKAVADKIVTVVGDRIILYSDIRNAVDDAVRLNGGKLPDNALCNATEQALISKMLMLQAEKDSLVVPEEDIEAELDQRINYFAKQLGGSDMLESVSGKSIYQLREDSRAILREHHLAENMQRKILSSVRITPSEVNAFFERISIDSLPFFESELEIGNITIYPGTSPELEDYVIGELNNYKRQVESKSISFNQLAARFSERCGNEEKDLGSQYVLSRNDASIEPRMIAAVFKLQAGNISAPLRTASGYYLVQLLEKNGDEAVIRHIFRRVPPSEEQIRFAKMRLDSLRAKLYAAELGFMQAAKKMDQSKSAQSGQFFLHGQDGSSFLKIDQLDKPTVMALSKINPGDYSAPFVDKDENERTIVRMIYLKSRSQPHRMNLKDDYSRIADAALNQKRAEVMSKWIKEKVQAYSIEVDPEFAILCKTLLVSPRNY